MTWAGVMLLPGAAYCFSSFVFSGARLQVSGLLAATLSCFSLNHVHIAEGWHLQVPSCPLWTMNGPRQAVRLVAFAVCFPSI